MALEIKIPELSMVVLVGPSGSGKSTFGKKHFLKTEILSSDYCRGLVSDDENNQKVTNQAFELLHYIAAQRLALGKLVVVDATNVQVEARRSLIQLARKFHFIPVAIVLDLPAKVCQARNESRQDRQFGKHVIRQQRSQLRRSRKALRREGFRYVYWMNSEEEVAEATVKREPLWTNRKDQHGPFDIIGDVHGCHDELIELLAALDYKEAEHSDENGDKLATFRHPEGRQAVFLGDLVDRGPKSPQVLQTVMDMVVSGDAICIPGNHDMKLLRKLRGKNVQITHGLAETIQQLETEPPEFIDRVNKFLDSLISHYVLDDGKLVVAHAGMREEMAGRGSGAVRQFALFGDTTGETDEYGLPVRFPWAEEYRGGARVVYGHSPVPESEWLNRTVNIDTGCVFGGSLTALRYPEIELVSVKAKATYYESVKPFLDDEDKAPALTSQQQLDDVLDMEDVSGKRIIQTRLHRTATIREGNACAALEVMSRFAVNPKWLIYLPPTMSPCETSRLPNLLEHPQEAFDFYRNNGQAKVVCQAKHMGSRAVLVVCRDQDVARKRFGVSGEGFGVCYTRTGRRFFKDDQMELAILTSVKDAMYKSGLWTKLETDWICLDCELMPWSVKAQELLSNQYAAVGSSSRAALKETIGVLEMAASAGLEIGDMLESFKAKAEMAQLFTQAYRNYCWPVESPADLKLAPFHIMASESQVHVDKDHVWHMETCHELCDAADDMLLATKYKVVDLTDRDSCQEAVSWWEELAAEGGEGMVVKSFDFFAKGKRGLLQPAVKCRGKEYLRIIYGLEYTAEQNLERLKKRGLSVKRSLALREFSLGIEALERFVRREPLRRVHECVFGVLALESEAVDPRL